MNSQSRRGFTLVELMVVISIISVLSSTLLTSISAARMRGRDAYRISQIKEVQNALALYYSIHGQYPANAFTNTVLDSNVPKNWARMIFALNTDGLISATVSKNETDSNRLQFSFINTANAQIPIPPAFAYCSIQDPLYKGSLDFANSYGYMASGDNKSYIIRIRLENPNNPLFAGSITGGFLTATEEGNTACDTSLRYYCTGSIL